MGLAEGTGCTWGLGHKEAGGRQVILNVYIHGRVWKDFSKCKNIQFTEKWPKRTHNSVRFYKYDSGFPLTFDLFWSQGKIAVYSINFPPHSPTCTLSPSSQPGGGNPVPKLICIFLGLILH